MNQLPTFDLTESIELNPMEIVPLEEESLPKPFQLEEENIPLLVREDSKEEKSEENPLPKKKPLKDVFELASENPMAYQPVVLFSQEVKEISSVGRTESIQPMPQEMVEVFEKVCFIATKLYQSGDSETTVYLDQHFASPLFQGAEIVISEFNTAPKIFNVQINACREAVALLQGQTNSLATYIAEKPIPFQFGRITLSLKEERATRRYKVQSSTKQDKQSGTDGSL